MNKIELFKNESFGEIRTLFIDDEVWLVGKDVAEALGYKNTRDALSKHIDIEDKTDVAIYDGSQNRNMTIINESGLYFLILSSELPQSKEFKRWVTNEVLPTIRKTGTYTIQPALETSQVSFKEQVECVGIVADILRVNEVSKVLMLSKVYEENNVSSKFLPEYVEDGNRERRSATELLKKFLGMNTTNFNALLVRNGYLEERTRKSKKTDTVKKFKALTEKGLQFGENMISVFNQKEVQPMYYVDSFLELFSTLKIE